MKNRMFVGLVAAATALVLSSSIASADDAVAYSANAIGVIKKTLDAKKMALISVPLEDTTSTNAAIPFFELPFLSSLPNGSSINIWDSHNSQWLTANKVVGKWRGTATNEAVQVGQAIFVQNGGSSEVSLLVSGEVPAEGNISVPLVNAGELQACANPYPVPFTFTNSTLASGVVNGSTVNFWDSNAGTAGAWVTANKVVGKWRGTGAAYVVQPGEGFMLQQGASAASGGSWSVDKPYIWPEAD